MSKIVVTHNFKRLETMLKGLGDKKSIQKAVARSIKRTLPTVQKAAFTQIRAKKLLKLKNAEVKDRARAYLHGNGSTPVASQYGKIWFTPKAESLGKFYARRVAAGRSSAVARQGKDGAWQGVRLYRVKLNEHGAPYLKDPKRSFLVDRKGGKIVFARMAGSKRLPIQKLKGPGMAELLQKVGVIRTLVQVASTRYQVEFDHQVKFYAEQAIKRAMRSK